MVRELKRADMFTRGILKLGSILFSLHRKMMKSTAVDLVVAFRCNITRPYMHVTSHSSTE